MKKKLIYIFAIIIIVILCLSFCDRPEKFDSVEEIRDGEQKGDVLVAAVEAFHKEMERYPANLDELVPKYISEIPKTLAGKEFSLRIIEGDIYYVSFPVTTKSTRKIQATCSYMKHSGFWDCSLSSQ